MKKYTYGKQHEVLLHGETLALPINTTDKSGCCVQMLDKTFEQMIVMLSHYSKVSMIRIDLKMKNYTGNNADLSNFIDEFKDQIQVEYKKKEKAINKKRVAQGKPKISYDIKRIGYVWGREYEKAENKNQHYHLHLLFDGHIVQSVWTISQIAKRMISSLSRYHIFGKHSHVNEVKILTRDDLESFADAFKWASYPTKERGKGYRDKTANDYSTSRIKPNMDKMHLVFPQLIQRKIDDRPEFELTMCEQPQPRPTKPKPHRITTNRVKQQAVNDAQLDLFDNVA